MKAAGINKRQVRLIHVAASRLGVDDADYRHILQERYGVATCKAMNFAEAEDLLAHFQKCGFAIKGKGSRTRFNDLARRPGMASPAQLRKIEAMWAEVCKAADKGHALRKFLWKTVKVADLRFLDSRGAHDTIEAIKDIRQRKYSSPPYRRLEG